MIVTDPAGGASLGPRLGYGSFGGFRPIRLRNYTREGWSDSTKTMIRLLFWIPFIGAGVGAGGGALLMRTATAVAPRLAALPFRPSTWAALNFYQERGDLASLIRGEKQTLEITWGVKPIALNQLPLGLFPKPGVILPLFFPRFDLTPVRQDDITKLEETTSQIKLPDFIQSPGNSSQVLPAGSVSPGGTALGWIPVITTGRKRRKRLPIPRELDDFAREPYRSRML